jgi:hypothetical protein
MELKALGVGSHLTFVVAVARADPSTVLVGILRRDPAYVGRHRRRAPPRAVAVSTGAACDNPILHGGSGRWLAVRVDGQLECQPPACHPALTHPAR